MKKMHCVEEHDSLYISDEQQNEVSDNGVELLNSNSCMGTLYTNRQKAIEMAEDKNMLLRFKNDELKDQIQSSRQSLQNVQLFVNELEDLHAAKAEKDQICGKIKARCKEVAKENETLRQRIEDLSHEVSSFLLKRQQTDEDITNLNCVLRTLQQQLKELSFDLEHKEELINQKDSIINQLKDSMSEYITINQGMKEKLKDLEDQLALALVKSEGNFMSMDPDTMLSGENWVSLGEELGLFTDQTIPEQEQKEEEENAETLKEQATLYVSKSMTHSCRRSITRGVCAAVALCFSVLGVVGALTPNLPTDIMNSVHRLIEPCCQVFTTGPPPV
ncbi:paramyosin-like [Silurus meridionalis]|uniref:KASH5-like coiled-coil domain-containing protein n=1 Tax=Silurus meridionalis TaxID=175797 RepID=A0A8T0AGI1_SILME|nr:paramyosin-like [Silurus meridionalis]XP_046689790.1 paramyosin-like [Silurus meridionalis]XP_046689792.1 paramyosin-like [Silurus meridionalis]XP_046689793.1 paramyosin-like [Silurus meridionalis]XP_046689794.1 paramyosin-like [Silurus meridionalis]KAF7691569.1 hypothetical protein HF521_010536 [Silurus meridionalis]